MVSRAAKASTAVIVLGLACAGAAYLATAPEALPDSHWADLGAPDLENGARVFWAGGCASCHAAPGAKDGDRLVLSGGLPLKSPFGTFYGPNISPDPVAGIGGWTLAQFGNAMKRGVGAAGEHLYPAFPYGSYTRMTDKDVNDLWGFLGTLPKSANVAPAHELPFPFNIRFGIGVWKLLYFSDAPRVVIANADERQKHGQYLVEGLGHCGECHTPRTQLGGLIDSQWLAGAPNPEGEGRVPDITPGSKSIGSWSEGDIASYLETGFTPDYDSVGGAMVEVQRNMAMLPSGDREAIAAYLKAIPAR